MKGSSLVSTRRWIPHAFTQAEAGPLPESPEGQRADTLAQAARGIVILAFALGALGIEAAPLGHVSADHASGHQSENGIHLAASVRQISGDVIVPMPWMY